MRLSPTLDAAERSLCSVAVRVETIDAVISALLDGTVPPPSYVSDARSEWSCGREKRPAE